jgi:uncharacterized protein (DUF3084 family)
MLDNSPLEDARRWRNKAKHARDTAKLMYRDETKGRLFAIADHYDQLAEQAEQVFASEKPLSDS